MKNSANSHRAHVQKMWPNAVAIQWPDGLWEIHRRQSEINHRAPITEAKTYAAAWAKAARTIK